MNRTGRNDRMLALVGLVALIILAIFFYMQWNAGIQARVDDRMRNNPALQTTGALQTRIAAP